MDERLKISPIKKKVSAFFLRNIGTVKCELLAVFMHLQTINDIARII